MAKIRVNSKCTFYDGMSLTFKAPCDSAEVDGLNVYDGSEIQSFTFRDTHGNDLASLEHLFSEGAYVKVILDTNNGFAFIQNADTNAYLQEQIAAKLDAIQDVSNAGKFFKVAPDGSIIFENPVAKFSNGPVIITESQTLDMTKYGLYTGDQVNVVVVGGGGGGGGSKYNTYYAGGDAGKTSTVGHSSAGGGGGGYGGGGGGAYGVAAGDSSWSSHSSGGGGGGGGYLAAGTITLTGTTVDVTVGAGGKGGTASSTKGGDGGTSSFGSYLSAAGGTGGTQVTGGTGGHKGGTGKAPADNNNSSNLITYAGGGGGGGGGWIITSATVYTGSDGTDGTAASASNVYDGEGGIGGTDGGNGGGDGGVGHGVVLFWY